MAGVLDSFVDRMVSIVTNDGRVLVGKLKGFDQNVNVILVESQERVYSMTEGVEIVPLGLYIVRGDNIAMIGEIDEAIDEDLDFDNIRAHPIKPVVH